MYLLGLELSTATLARCFGIALLLFCWISISGCSEDIAYRYYEFEVGEVELADGLGIVRVTTWPHCTSDLSDPKLEVRTCGSKSHLNLTYLHSNPNLPILSELSMEGQRFTPTRSATRKSDEGYVVVWRTEEFDLEHRPHLLHLTLEINEVVTQASMKLVPKPRREIVSNKLYQAIIGV